MDAASPDEPAGPAPDPTREDLRAILNALPAMVGYWDRELRNRLANDAYVEYFGLRPEQMHGMHIREVLGPELYASNHPFMERALAGEAQLFDREIPTPSGAHRYTQASYIPDVTPDGVRGFFVLVTDITERRRAEEALAVAESRFRQLFSSAPIGMFLVDARGTIVDINRAGADLLGRAPEDLVGRDTAAITHPDDVEGSRRQQERLFAGEVESYRIEKRYLRHDGAVVWAQLDATLVRGAAGAEALALGQVQDITERRRHQEQLEHLAHHDELTGLLNRRGLERELERQRAAVERYRTPAALLIVDLDGFKDVNDTLGHQAGDALIAEVAQRLTDRLRETDVVARMGGDEFAVILPHATAEDAEAVAQALTTRLREPYVAAPALTVTASIGVASFAAGVPADATLIRADLAMYRVKAHGGDGVAPHTAATTSS